MILIPAENQVSRKNPPYLTVALILLNIAAFIFLQGDDNKIFDEAVTYYFEEDLFQKEKDIFEDYALNNRIDLYNSIHNNDYLPKEYIAQIILLDKRFASHIQDLSSYSLEWRQKRDELNSILDKSSLYSYAYFPSDPSIFTAFTHMFMHGGIDHLIGNMLFLFLFGFNLELLMGRSKTFALYIASGLVAVTFFSLTAADKYVPLVGASGAIAGLMGGFAGWYGLKNIRYFYWLFVVFNYIRLPAALVLLYWLGKELIMSSISDDNVAYMAHFGGLLGGLTCALAFKLSSKVTQKVANVENTAEVSVPKHEDTTTPNQTRYEEACLAFQNLDFDRARQIFSQLIKSEPENLDYYTKYFALEKTNPQTNQFSGLCDTIILISTKNPRFNKLMEQALDELTHHGQGLKSLPASTLIVLSRSLIKRNHLQPARPIVNFLVKHYDFKEYDVKESDVKGSDAKGSDVNEQIPQLLFQYGLACEKNDDWNTYHKVFTYLSKKHSDSFVGEEARKALEQA